MKNIEILKYLIKLSGLTQKQYEIRHGIGQKKMYHWLSGYRNIQLKTLQELAKKDGYEITITFKITKL